MEKAMETESSKSMAGAGARPMPFPAAAPPSASRCGFYGAGPLMALGFPLQAKLEVGSPDDPLEAEADAMADRVMRMADPAASTPVSLGGAVLRRKCGCSGTSGGGCEECGIEQLQRKADGQASRPGVAPGSVHATLATGGRPLEPSVRAYMEPRFGHDFSRVRVHADAKAADSAAAVAAHAYTVGDHIVFGQGRFTPRTDGGRRLLAHELAHTIQQGAAPRLGGNSAPLVQRQVIESSMSNLDLEYQTALDSGDWLAAAEWLNGFSWEDIQARLARLAQDQIASLHQGALGNPRLGPQSNVALLTQPGNPLASTLPPAAPAAAAPSRTTHAAAAESDEWTTGETVAVTILAVAGTALVVGAVVLIVAGSGGTLAPVAMAVIMSVTPVAEVGAGALAGEALLGSAIALEVTGGAAAAAAVSAPVVATATFGAATATATTLSVAPMVAPAVVGSIAVSQTSAAALATAAVIGLGSAVTLQSDQPAPEPDRRTRRPCNVARYGSLICLSGEQAHHIVADYTLRFGTRSEGMAGVNRILGLPSFYDGPSICLLGHARSAGDEHNIAHSSDAAIHALGMMNTPRGTAPISAISAIAMAGARSARPECGAEILAGVAQEPSLLGATPGRTTIMPPGRWPPV